MNMFYDKIIKKNFSLILDRSKTTLTAKPSKTQAYHTLDYYTGLRRIYLGSLRPFPGGASLHTDDHESGLWTRDYHVCAMTADLLYLYTFVRMESWVCFHASCCSSLDSKRR